MEKEKNFFEKKYFFADFCFQKRKMDENVKILASTRVSLLPCLCFI